jgi:spore coat polysaccharide biosynthesis predicted glycosyltransferase SpsG
MAEFEAFGTTHVDRPSKVAEELSEYCSLEMFVEQAESEQDPDLRMMTQIIDVNGRWDMNGWG